jgi:hypothetical protein
MISGYDLPYAFRQIAAVTILVAAPAGLYTWCRRRRLFYVLIGPMASLSGLWLLFQTLATSASVWRGTQLPYTPFRVGPSYLSLLELGWILPLILWTPFAASWLLGSLWRRRRHIPRISPGAAALALSVYMGLATCATTMIFVGVEYAHEDTVVAPGFSLGKWRRLRIGMTREEVHRLLGEPLRGRGCSFDPTAECWVANFSAGHFAAVWFEGDAVNRIQRWYSD